MAIPNVLALFYFSGEVPRECARERHADEEKRSILHKRFHKF